MQQMYTADMLSSNPDRSPMNIIKWINDNFEKVFLVIGLLAIIGIITFQTVYRYVIVQFSSSAGAAVWTEEISRYIFIWISYLALSVAIRKRSSIRVDILYDQLPKRFQKISWIVVNCCFLLLTILLCITGWGQIERLLEFPQHTAALRIPLYYSLRYITFWFCSY